MKNILINLTCLLLLAGCKLKDDYDILVNVKDNHGRPIKNAEIRLGNKTIGYSNINGFFSSVVSLVPDKSIRMEVTKESQDLYYAPYFKRFKIPALVEKKPRSFKFDAILYSVPKPNTRVDGRSTNANLRNTNSYVKDKSPMKNTTKLKKNELNEIMDKNKKEDGPSPIALKFIKPLDAAHKNTIFPVLREKNIGNLVYTVQTMYAKKSLPGVTIYKGDSKKGELREVCITNSNGRCTIRFDREQEGSFQFVAKINGYKTLSKIMRIKDNSVLRFSLEKGNSIDFFTTTRRYNYTKGLANTEVFIDGKKAGETDSFGRFSYFHVGKKEDLIDVSIRPKGYLPESYQTDFIIQGPMTVVKYFTPLEPPKPTIGVVPIKNMLLDRHDFSVKSMSDIRHSLRKEIGISGAFEIVGFSAIKRGFAESGITESNGIKRGWNDTQLKGRVDALVLPVIRKRDGVELEISIIDSLGRILAVARAGLQEKSRRKLVNKIVVDTFEQLVNLYPFEGTVLNVDSKVTLNIGREHKRRIKLGDNVFVWGVQSDKSGQKREHKHIATLAVNKVSDRNSTANIIWMASRAVIQRGDLIQLVRTVNRQSSGSNLSDKRNNTTKILVTNESSSKPVKSANVYFSGKWIGSTGDDGSLVVPKNTLGEYGKLLVSKSGFGDFVKESDFSKKSQITIPFSQKLAFLRVDSQPTGARVLIDGKFLGKTPFNRSVKVPVGFLSLELDGVRDYRKFKQVIELGDGTLDLTGPQKIMLEIDYLKMAFDHLESGRIKLAKKKFSEIEENHSDYLKARHALAEILLSYEDNPVGAIKELKSVTSYPSVTNFQDKRFVSAYVNLALAYFRVAENQSIEKKWDLSVENYSNSISEFKRVKPYLRFITQKDYGDVLHTVNYHSALAKHRVALMKKDQVMLRQAYYNWTDYVGGISVGNGVEATNKDAYLDNARIYLKQVKRRLKQSNL